MSNDLSKRLDKAERQAWEVIGAEEEIRGFDGFTIYFIEEDVHTGQQYADLQSLLDFQLEREARRQRGHVGMMIYFTPENPVFEPIPDWLLPREKKLDRGHFGDSV